MDNLEVNQTPGVTVRLVDANDELYLLGFKDELSSFVGLRDVNREKLRKRKWSEDKGQRVAPVDLVLVGGLEADSWFCFALAPV